MLPLSCVRPVKAAGLVQFSTHIRYGERQKDSNVTYPNAHEVRAGFQDFQFKIGCVFHYGATEKISSTVSKKDKFLSEINHEQVHILDHLYSYVTPGK